MCRGSRKHILDWVEHPHFLCEFLELAEPVCAQLSEVSQWMPVSYKKPREARLKTFGPECLPNHPVWPVLLNWWLVHTRGANTPNWDLAVACKIDGQDGLVLVEAKAHNRELSVRGKSLASKASCNSKKNHEHIGRAIEEVRVALDSIEPGVRISRDSHYQLSNRVAFAWKLASLGIPTVLVYLGFTGDMGIVDLGVPLTSDVHWREVFFSHTDGVLPSGLLERKLCCGAAPAWILLRSRPIIEPSSPRPAPPERSTR